MGALLLWGALAASAWGAPPSKAHVIVIENMQFNPPVLTVQRGERVEWVNKDLFPHTASAAADAFDSKTVAAGASWTYTAANAGVYPYVCRLHPGMQGKLIVK